MSRYTGNKAAAAPRKGGSPLLTGILIGVVVGVGMAAGVAWYMMKAPSPFLQKPPVANNAVVDVTKPLPPAGMDATTAPPAGAPSSANNSKPRFEFYNVLADKPGAKSTAPDKPAEKAKPPENTKQGEGKPVVAYEPQILQVGSFSSTGDAEKLKARLALIGAEAHIQIANVPDKGVRYRVRLGPYKSDDEMNRARSFLKQNEVDSTPMRAQ